MPSRPSCAHLLFLLLLYAILTFTPALSAGGSQPITVAYAGTTRPDIGSLARDLESTLTNVAVSVLPTHKSAAARCPLRIAVQSPLDMRRPYAALLFPSTCCRSARMSPSRSSWMSGMWALRPSQHRTAASAS